MKRRFDESGEPGPVTIEGYGKLWVARRKERGIFSARDDENRFKRHVNPRKLGLVRFGTMALSEIRPIHIRGLIDALKTEPDKKKRLAPRSIRAVYGMLHTMFVDAKMEGLISSNPCELPRGILPKMRDKDPLWRATALFTVGEVEQLI